MKKYKGRKSKGFVRVVTVAYLVTAISFGASCCAFSIDRAFVKNDYKDGSISHETYISKCKEMQKREEKILKTIGLIFGTTFVMDIVTGVVGSERE